MWTSDFPLLTVLLLLNVMDLAFSNGQNDSLSVLAPKITQFKLSLHHLLEGARIRRKRQVLDENAHEQQMRFASSAQEDLPYLSDYNLTVWVPVWHQSQRQALIATNQGHLILFEFANDDDKFARTIAVSEDEANVIKAKAFSHYDDQWFVALQSDNSHLHHIRLYQKIGRGLEKRQTITLDGDSDIDLITVRNTHYLVVATYQTKTSQGYSYRAEVKLYQWIESQFDEIASRVTYGAKTVSCWVLDGSLYMAVGQERDDEGVYNIGSPVYIYNAKEKNTLVMLEKLDTFGPKKVLHFYVSNNHYVIFIGASEAVIYWWSSGQFLEWQTIKGTANAADVSVLTLENGEVAIVIALVEEALFLTLDVSGYYIISFVMSFAGSSLSSLQFMHSGQAYYALAVFAESFRHRSHSIYKLTVEPYNLMTGSSLDSLQECLSSVNDILDERETELKFVNAELGRVWLAGKDQKITRVHITGHLSSVMNTIVRQILIVVEHKLLTDSPTRDDVIEELSRSKSVTNNVRNDLDDIVLKSSTQDIKGTLEFFNPIPIPSLNMKSSNLDIAINGIFVTSLLNRALRKNGDQTFFGPTLAADISTEQLELSSLNGIALNDLLFLRGQQTVTGLLKFSNVQSSVISATNINSIPVENLVLTNSDQTIFDLKSASHLNSLVIDVHKQTNGKNLEEVKNKVVLTETDDELMGRLTWNSPVTISGDLFVPGLINGVVDLSKIAQDSVQKNIQQDLTGTLFFMTPQFVSADMTVTGLINDVNTRNLLTKDSVQSISGPIAFKEALFIHNELMTGSVNNVNLRESAVLKSPPYTHYDQFVSGLKMFWNNLDVSDVDMTEYVTLDGVDPSLLMQDIVRHKEGVVKENRTTFDRVVVTGDVTALSGINGHEVMDLQHMFWLKSKPQTIEADVGLERISIDNDLEVEQINFLSLDDDVVRSFGNESIESEKSFDHIVNVRRLEHSRGTLINGIDVFSFKTELEREVGEWTVHGIKLLESLEVHGDLSAGALGDLHGAMELMQPKAFQTVKGEVVFSSELTMTSDLLRAEDLFFDTINGVSFRNYLDNAVTSPSISRRITNKVFSYLEGSEMQLHNGSTIGRKSLFEFLPRVVTLNSMQLIPSSKIFNSALHFFEVVANELNGLEMSSYASRIVLQDDFKVISVPKEFNGVVEMDFIYVQNYVNGIKMENLAKNSFSKTSDNEVFANVTFLSDVDIGQLLTNSINGLNMSHLLLTNRDEILGSSWFLSDVECSGDVFITGLINGCDLAMIQRNAFYTNKTQQVISTEITVDSIQVLGNVVIRNSTSQSQIDILKRSLVLISDEEVIAANFVIDSSVFANTLKLAALVNGIDLNLIFNDAVRHSVPQEIRGFKAFTDDVATSLLKSQGIFLHGHLAGVNLQKLLERAVMKKGYQVIAGEKIFQFGNLVMDVVTAQGRLNGLYLPQDVIRTDTSELITHPTFFMSDIYLNNELIVGGRIDGIDLDGFLKNRISLTAEQEIRSQLTFWEDAAVSGNLGVGGMINDVVLEMVVNLRHPHPIGGYKSFANLKVTGSLQTSRINGYDPINLEKDILKFDREEFLNEIQVFEKPLQINSLNTEWINGIPMNQLSSLAYSILNGLRSILSVFKDVTSSVQEQLGHQLSSAGTQLSKFAYFVLIQELDLGSASKILHGYRFEHSLSEFSHSMVVWTAQKHCGYMGKCCETEFTYWMRVRKSGHVMVDGDAEMGRYYPIHNPAPVSYDKDFFMWTNTTQLQPKWCRGKGKGKMQLASYTDGGQMEVFMEILHSPSLSEVKTFRSGSLYAVAGFFYDTVQGEYSSTVVYSFNEVRREWTEHQILPSFGVLSLDITVGKNGEIILALGTGMATNPESYSTIYAWNAENKQFVTLQSISSRFVTTTLWIHQESSLLLAMSGVQHWPRKDTDCFEHISGGQIDIYVYEENATWIQSIPLQGVASMVSFTIAGDAFIAAASSQLQTINIYAWKGYAGFSLMQSIFAGEVRHLNTYSIDGGLFMTVAKASGSSEILKAITQGRSDPSHLGYKRLTSDQSDETSLEEKLVSRCR